MDYEKEMEKTRKTNDKYLSKFERWLKNVNDIIRMYKKCNIRMHKFVHSFVILTT